jgi:hypothetical protein
MFQALRVSPRAAQQAAEADGRGASAARAAGPTQSCLRLARLQPGGDPLGGSSSRYLIEGGMAHA